MPRGRGASLNQIVATPPTPWGSLPGEVRVPTVAFRLRFPAQHTEHRVFLVEIISLFKLTYLKDEYY